MGPWRGLSGRRRALPALLAGAIALAGFAGFALTRSAVRQSNAGRTDAAASTAGSAVDAQLQSDAAVLTAAGSTIDETTSFAGYAALFPSGRAGVVASATVGGTGAFVLRVLSASDGSLADRYKAVDIGGQPAWQLALALARDGARTTTGASTAADGSAVVLEARPLYGTDPAPAAVADRRAALVGYLVVIRPGTAFAPLLAEGAGTGSAARLLQGTTGVAATSPAAPHQPTSTDTANDGGWTVEAWSTGAASSAPYVILFGALVIAVGVGAAFAASERATTAEAREAVARADQLRLVARMGPLLQQTLETAELLPLFVVEVSEQLGLSDISLSLVSGSGQLTKAFSVGRAPQPAGGPGDDLPNGPVDRGTSLAVPLQRGGRVIGVLNATASNGLEASQVDALRAVCDLLVAALGNAAVLQEEQDLVARLRDVDRLKATFLGAVSHELRTMVIAIQGFADLLIGQGPNLDDTRKRDFIDRIARNARSLGVLVEDLLDFARLESASASVSLQPVDLSDLVPKIVDQVSSIIGERDVAVDVEPGVVAMADGSAVERILVNLLSNAAKYTPIGTTVAVSVRRHEDMAEAVVSDDGPGIDAAERDRIFDLFYRVDNEAARAARGVGIGLALVRQLADVLQGEIVAEEAPGGGARFRLSVPLADVRDRRQLDVHAS